MFEKIKNITDFLWGVPLSILMVGTGLYLSIRIGMFQFIKIPTIFKKTIGQITKKDNDKNDGNLSPFEALSTVLAGTIGSGSIAGVAVAIAIGGPGAVFWMWLIAFFGMATKMAEVTLAVNYREKGKNGEYYGGPMYYIKNGLGKNCKFLSYIYSIAMVVICLTDACVIQVNTTVNAMENAFNIPTLITGAVIVVSSFIIIIMGIKSIGNFCSKLVPLMTFVYIVLTLGVVIINFTKIPEIFLMIFKYAFAPTPATGGFLGATIAKTIGNGVSKGIFSNEAGMGTSSTVHATAKTDHPVHQGLYGVIEVLATMIICTLTALSILCSGVWTNGHEGIDLAFDSFRQIWGNMGAILGCIAVTLFAYSSYLGFFVEYRTAVSHAFSKSSFKYLKWLYFAIPIVSSLIEVKSAWDLADIAVGFIVIPNIIALILLSPKFVELFKKYRKTNISSSS